MSRLHKRWCEIHPEANHLTQQNLRDYVKHILQKSSIESFFIEESEDTTQINNGISPGDSQTELQINLTDTFMEKIAEYKNRQNRKPLAIKKNYNQLQMKTLNNIIDSYLTNSSTTEEINCAVYAAASILCSNNSLVPKGKAYKHRIEKLDIKIKECRRNISHIQCLIYHRKQGLKFTKKVKKIAKQLRRKHHTLNNLILNTLKQHAIDKLLALRTARKKVVQSEKRFTQNRDFENRPSSFIKKVNNLTINKPNIKMVEQYWKQIYEQQLPIAENNKTIVLFEEFCRKKKLERGHCPEITIEHVHKALSTKRNFSASGPDGISNFWWKKFNSSHKHLARTFNNYLLQEETIPQWLVEGRTVLIPKKGDLSSPKNYRPITCLNTQYKILTSVINEIVLEQINPVWLKIPEQRGAKRGIAGCKDNLLIDRCICQDSRQYKRNLSMAWVDYRKAFDTTPHQLIIILLEIMKVHPNIIRCIKDLMAKWKTKFQMKIGTKIVCTNSVNYHRGVFQGDSLSPLLFCITLLPLSVALQKTSGYMCGRPSNRKHKVTHLFYMDDLKLYAANESSIKRSLEIVKDYTNQIKMEFGLEKCAVVNLNKGRIKGFSDDIDLTDNIVIKHLQPGEHYTYLGIDENTIQDERKVKTIITQKYNQTLRKIWKSELSGKNKIQATNTLAVPIVTYSFGVIKWTVDELLNLDRKTRKIMTINRSLHPRSSVERIYLQRVHGGRGLLGLENMHKKITIQIACKISESKDQFHRLINDHEIAGIGAFLFQAAKRAASDLELNICLEPEIRKREGDINNNSSTKIKDIIKKTEQEDLLRKHTGKSQHGVFYRNMAINNLSKLLTFTFLRSPRIMSETEGFLFACQDGVIPTLAYRKEVQKEHLRDILCRSCKKFDETLMHILAGCPNYAKYLYIERHNNALRVLYFHLRYHYNVDLKPIVPYVPHEIEAVVDNEYCRIYWNYPFHTTNKIVANKPDIVVIDKKEMELLIIEFSCPSENNISTKFNEKLFKYEELKIDLQKQYPFYKIKIIPIIIGVLGGMDDGTISSLNKIRACNKNQLHILQGMQKSAILGSLNIIRRHGLP